MVLLLANQSQTISKFTSKTNQKVNVVDLINFDECDQVQDETVLAASQGGGIDAYGSLGLCDQLPDERRDDLLPPALPIRPSSPRPPPRLSFDLLEELLH